ncbi:MAG: ABC transporter ATP-binding protein [Lachnospiraceae bacterium]|jgi:branched-chain amino acid transport system ATP-binding protein
MKDEMILKISNLDKAFGGLKVLQNVDFNIKRGEKRALIGPNGAGKTTLLNAIGGQGLATAGKIVFNMQHKTGKIVSRNITQMSPNRRLHLGISKSFQVNNLFWRLNILQNVLLALYGAETNHIRFVERLERKADYLAKAERLLGTINLWDKREESPTLLSYGEQRLLEMLLAYASKPDLVLLDEPSAGLPTAEVDAFIETLKKLNGDTTMLFVAHDMDLVFSLADNISVLYYGQIIASGPPDEIANDPRVQEIYLGADEDPTCDICEEEETIKEEEEK